MEIHFPVQVISSSSNLTTTRKTGATSDIMETFWITRRYPGMWVSTTEAH